MSTLTTSQLTKRFGSLVAVDHVDFEARSGRIQGLIGPNGAGKTTLISCLTGRLSVTEGEITHNGERINGLAEFEISRRGIATAEQLVSIYRSQSVLGNVVTAFHAERDERLWDAVFKTATHRSEQTELEEEGLDLLAEVSLKEHASADADKLAYGQKKRLMIAMALATNPEFLILDEPVAGLNPDESAAIMDILEELVEIRDVGVLLIEHDMDVVMGHCDYVTVLESGQKIAEGPPGEIQENVRVQEAYLG